MTISKKNFVHLLAQFYFVSITICQPDFTYHFCIDTNGNYTNTSTYKANLNTLLSSISSTNQTNSGFYNISVGQGPDQVNGIALCRGDVESQDCHKCLNDSTILLPQLCPTQKDAVGWYDYCMLRYSNLNMMGISDNQNIFYLNNVQNVSNENKFNDVLGNLLSTLQRQAALGDSQFKFATGQASIDDYNKVYALAQCTPDLSYLSCFNCLGDLINLLPSCCANRKGSHVDGPSCVIRYELYLFYNNLPSPPPPPLALSAPPPSASSSPPLIYNTTGSSVNGSKTAKIAILITVPTVISIFVGIILCFFCRRKKSNKIETPSSLHQDDSDESRSLVSLQYGFDTIRVATKNFSDANAIGKGGFGTVYKGILADGKEIAVKRFSMDSGQGDSQFKTEVLLLARLQHRNLVRLLGFCLEKEERLLIYEFVPNTSLDHFLFDVNKRSILNWENRYKIITGIARGVLYLHEDSRLRIIHRDLKASNILLDADMNPKIADFGMARLFGVDQTQGDTSKIAGTYGYMAPEYVLHGFFSVKSDVYSFGVLVLEIITGRKNWGSNHGDFMEDLISCVWRNWRQGTPLDIVDPTILTGPRDHIIKCIHIGLLCVQEHVEDRPTMSSAVLMLSSHSLTLPMPSRPAFVTLTATARIKAGSDLNKNKLQGHSFATDDSITSLDPR